MIDDHCRSEEAVLAELTHRIAKTCGITRYDLGRNLYVRFCNATVQLVVVDVETPAQLHERLREQDARARRMDELQAKLKKLGIDLSEELCYVEEGEYPK